MKKNKLKTRKSLTKRIKITKTGKIFHGRSFTGHLRVKKSASKKRRQGRQVEFKSSYAKRIRKALGLRARKSSNQIIHHE